MYSYKYPHPAVTTDCVIFGYDGTKLKVLLIERGNEPYKGRWAFPGGFLNMDESAEQGARRELMEETGMTAEYIEQFHAFTDPDRDPRERVITIAYYALCKIQEVRGGATMQQRPNGSASTRYRSWRSTTTACYVLLFRRCARDFISAPSANCCPRNSQRKNYNCSTRQ